MKWSNLREEYPNRWLLMESLNKRIENDTEYIDEVKLIEVIEDEKEISNILFKCRENRLIYHTSNESIEIKIRKHIGFRMTKEEGGACNE